MKIPLPRPRRPIPQSHNDNIKAASAVESMPFFTPAMQNPKAIPRVHRVREVLIFTNRGRYSHTAIAYWCKNAGFIRPGSQLHDDAHTVCEQCEHYAIKAGQKPSSELVGHPVAFTKALPRRPAKVESESCPH